MDLEPCQRCKAYREDEHSRCPARSCGCPCRNLQVDLHSPDTRLVVAQLCQANSRKQFIKGDSLEVQYVNALISDLLWSEMETLTGGVRRDEVAEALSPEEVDGVRYLLQAPSLNEVELAQVRQLLPSLEVLLAMAVRYRDRSAQALQPPVYREESAEPAPAPPTPSPAPRRPPANRKPIPMPRGSTMTQVTTDQAARAQQLSYKGMERNVKYQTTLSANDLMNQGDGSDGA